jgi:excisionase family DNA binding protein
MSVDDPRSNLLTVRETAVLLRQSERSVRRKLALGVIPGLRLGEGSHAPLRIPADALDRWLFEDDPEEAA